MMDIGRIGAAAAFGTRARATTNTTTGFAATFDRAAQSAGADQTDTGATGVPDYAAITPRQLIAAADALVAAGRAGAAALSGAVELAASAPDQDRPINMFAYLRHEMDANERTPGGMDAAFRQRTALAVLTRAQDEAGVPVRYDGDYPGAARTPTKEEIDAKLKQAIEDFRKEADMTPRERLMKKLRADVLKDMKLTEEALREMSPEQRAAVDKQIDAEVVRRMMRHDRAEAEMRRDADSRRHAA